ncbi:MAG: LamG domain-containing protein, partial [Candidatus Sungbacteria bacterium]|nr:LamG domain-containing protein [Candidatus Sungbacteria bacterium]
LDKEGNLWALNETTATLELWKKVTSDSSSECAGTPDKTWDETTTPALTNTAPTIQAASPQDLFVTDGTSTVDGKSQTVYVGTDQGVTVVNTNRANEALGSVKYYTKDWISEEMVGDIRGMWHLTDNAASSTVDDATLKGNDLTLYADSDGTPSTTANTTTVTATGVRGKGYNLDGSTNFLYRTDNDFNFTTEDFTISMWVNPDTFTTNSRTLLTYGDNSTTGYDLELTRTADGTATVTFKTYQAGPASQSTTATASNIRSAYYQNINSLEWYHIAVVRSGTSVRIYINGNDDTVSAGTHTNPATAAGSNLVIGAKQNGASQWYDGQLDEIMITATALSPSQIQRLALNGLHALKNHEGVDTDGDGSTDSDTIQQLYGTTNTVRAVTVDPGNSYLYVAANDGSDSGGV